MPSRILHRNRVVFQTRDFQQTDPRKALPRNKEGEPIDCAFAIPARSSKSPFRAGTPLVDKEEDLIYRCVVRLDPLEGWATTAFWQARWQIDHKALVAYAKAGYVDAAVEEGSQVRRYRCRDEHTLLESELHAKQKHRIAQALHRTKLGAELKATKRYGWR